MTHTEHTLKLLELNRAVAKAFDTWSQYAGRKQRKQALLQAYLDAVQALNQYNHSKPFGA